MAHPKEKLRPKLETLKNSYFLKSVVWKKIPEQKNMRNSK